MLAPLGAMLFLSFRIERMSIATAQAVFWGFAAIMGLSLAGILLVYTGTSVARVFFISAGTFAAMSLYGYTTSRDLSRFGSFLFMGLIGIGPASVVNIFVASGALQFAISVIGVLLFTGLTAYDTQRIKQVYLRAVAGSADLALIPARLTVDDLDAVGPIARLLRGVVDMGFVLTRVPGGRRSRDGAEALERLAGLAPAHQPAPRLSTPSRRGQHRFRRWRDGAGRDCGTVAGHSRKVRHHAS